VLGALAPLLDQVGASDVPSSAEGFRRKFGLDIEIQRKLRRIGYCDQHGCGFMQLVAIKDRRHVEAAQCEVGEEVIYDAPT
jgi:hypothetical protein